MKIRNALITLAMAAAAAAGPCLAADPAAYPSRPITLIVPFPPGGSTDIVARVLSQHLNTRFGWNVVVDNRAGASGVIGLRSAATSAPDGYTIVLGQSSNLVTDPVFNRRESTLKQLVPIVQTSSFPLVLLVDGTSPRKNLRDVHDAARHKPGRVSFANVGTGSMPHLIALDIEHQTGLQFMHVPYKGNGPAMNDLRGGQTDVFISSSAAAMELAKAGEVRMLASTSPQRSRFFPDVPTVAETVPGYSAVGWHGLLAPKGTPEPILRLINRNVNEVLRDEGLRATFDKQALDVVGGTPEQFSNMMTRDTARWEQIVSRIPDAAKK